MYQVSFTSLVYCQRYAPAISQCIKFHLINFYTVRDMLQPSLNVSSFIYFTSVLSEICSNHLSMYQVSFTSLVYCQRYAPAISQCIRFHLINFYTVRDMLQPSLNVSSFIYFTCILSEICSSHLSMYQVSFN